MINSWVLDNFKSINQRTELNFRPLTIFTGANSSGKSTILQSILLVTQTLQDQIESRSIVLNGWFKKFGTYSDIVFHREDEKRNIVIGFEIQDQDNYSREVARVFRYSRETEKAHCEFEISSGGKKDSLLPMLERLQISLQVGDDTRKTVLKVERDPARSELEKRVVEQGKGEYDENYFDYSISLAGEQLQYTLRRERVGTPIGCNLSHFLPDNMILYSVYRDVLKDMLTYSLLFDRSALSALDKKEKGLNDLLKDKGIEILRELRADGKLEEVEEENYERRMKYIDQKFTLQKFYYLFNKSELSIDEKREYINVLLKKLQDLPEKFLFDNENMEFSGMGVSTVKNFFCHRIKYLGPLREEPKSFYPLDTSNTPMELGLKGENTAAVYENNKKRIVSYVDPSYFEKGAQGNPEVREVMLSEAVGKWLVYLGVATRVTTDDRGMIGHELKIMNELKGMRQDLTHVGVGVSQVLPILVMSFLANKGDVIILEQPELHLHPKVQTRLADFFVTMTQLGKQCLIETHSEYFINRLRYRVAVADNDQIAKSTMIYFVEKDKKEGYSKYREVTINEYGVIEDWPEGFFDEGERIAAEILRAGMKKKMQQEEYEE